MAVRFEKLFVPEKAYPYIKATCAAEYANGTFGTVTSGTFTAGAGNYVIMEIEKGDDAKFDTWKTGTVAEVRIADLSAPEVQGLILDITNDLLPASGVAKGVTLSAASTGKLAVGGSTGLVVEEVCSWGVRASVAIGE